MLNKAQLLVVATLVSLAVLAASLISFGEDKVGIGCSTVGNFVEATGNTPLPNLSESVAPSQPSAAENQTDNSTTSVTSSGVVKASFTVVAAPPGSQEESEAAEGQAMPDNRARTASQARPESVGFTLRWVLLTSILLAAIAAIGVLAFVYSRARSQA